MGTSIKGTFFLTWLLDGKPGQFKIEKSPIVIGRSRACDLVLQVSSISRNHAEIFFHNDHWFVRDLDSSYGSWVNERKLDGHVETPIRPGDLVRLGKLEMTFSSDAQEPDAQRVVSETMEIKFSNLAWAERVGKAKSRLTEIIEERLKQVHAEDLKGNIQAELDELTNFVEAKFREYEVLQEISQQIGRILNLEELLSTALKLAVKVLGADRGFILTYDVHKGRLKSMVSHHFDRQSHAVLEHDFNFSQSIAKACFEKQEIIFIEDALQDQRFAGSESIVASSIRGAICIPLQQGQEVSGVIYMDNLSIPGIFRRDQLEFLKSFSYQTAIAMENARLYTQAVTDDLTKLYNRKYIDKRIFEEMGRCRRYGGAMSLIILDIDFFKSVNDTHGHTVGDMVLEAVSNVLQEAMRSTDILSRYGGEEFLMLLPETDLQGAVIFAERLRASIASLEVVARKGLVLRVTISLGVCEFDPKRHERVVQIVEDADQALYRAKSGGRNQVRVFSATP